MIEKEVELSGDVQVIITRCAHRRGTHGCLQADWLLFLLRLEVAKLHFDVCKRGLKVGLEGGLEGELTVGLEADHPTISKQKCFQYQLLSCLISLIDFSTDAHLFGTPKPLEMTQPGQQAS